MPLVSASIVLYNTSEIDLNKSLGSLLNEESISSIYLIDNSPVKSTYVKLYENNNRVIYIHNPANPGFGASHNIAINKSLLLKYNYHFIVNPDIYFDKGIVSEMVNYAMKLGVEMGMMMPQILNEDGSVQNLPRLLPSPYSIFMRKLKKPKSIYNKFIKKYEFRDYDKNKIYNIPILSGCFTLLNLSVIKEVGGYDDDFFMYFEDWDLSRRVHKHYKTLYYPLVSVYHGYQSGANKSFRLFKIYVSSLIIYFKKWGWFFDKERKSFNRKALNQLLNQ